MNMYNTYTCSYVPGARWDPVTPFGSGLPGRGRGRRPGRQYGYIRLDNKKCSIILWNREQYLGIGCILEQELVTVNR